MRQHEEIARLKSEVEALRIQLENSAKAITTLLCQRAYLTSAIDVHTGPFPDLEDPAQGFDCGIPPDPPSPPEKDL